MKNLLSLSNSVRESPLDDQERINFICSCKVSSGKRWKGMKSLLVYPTVVSWYSLWYVPLTHRYLMSSMCFWCIWYYATLISGIRYSHIPDIECLVVSFIVYVLASFKIVSEGTWLLVLHDIETHYLFEDCYVYPQLPLMLLGLCSYLHERNNNATTKPSSKSPY